MTVLFEPLKPYVISNNQYSRLISDDLSKIVYRTSALEPRLTNFHVKAFNEHSKKLLFWTGAGGYGDQILAWPVAHLLSRIGFEVHLLVEAGHTVCWWGFDWVKSITPFPTYYSFVQLFDHHCFFETVSNADEHNDQQHPVDIMLSKIGLNPDEVDSALKVVRPQFTHGELGQARSNKGDRKVGIYQLSAAGATRSLTPADSVHILDRLATEFPDLEWIAVYDSHNDTQFRLKAEALPHSNIHVLFFQNIRDLWAAIGLSEIVVAPDSLCIHVAGSMGVPCVGLWGPTNPALRVKYYKNHVALWNRTACPLSPCHVHHSEFPYFCPTRAEARRSCEVIMSISADEVVGAIKTLKQGLAVDAPVN